MVVFAWTVLHLPSHEVFDSTFVAQQVAHYRHLNSVVKTLPDERYLIMLLENLRFFPPLKSHTDKRIQNGGLVVAEEDLVMN